MPTYPPVTDHVRLFLCRLAGQPAVKWMVIPPTVAAADVIRGPSVSSSVITSASAVPTYVGCAMPTLVIQRHPRFMTPVSMSSLLVKDVDSAPICVPSVDVKLETSDTGNGIRVMNESSDKTCTVESMDVSTDSAESGKMAAVVEHVPVISYDSRSTILHINNNNNNNTNISSHLPGVVKALDVTTERRRSNVSTACSSAPGN